MLMARSLTLARWGTDDANGAAADPDAAGVLMVQGRRRDHGGQAQVGSARTPGRVGPGLSTTLICVSLSK